jgi:hypothetical protein
MADKPKKPWIDSEDEDEGQATTAAPVIDEDDEETKLRKNLALYTEEFRDLLGSDVPADGTRRQELRGLMRKTQRLLDAMEEKVVIDLPHQPTGQFYNVGTHTFLPGRHVVRKGIAQVLLHAASEAQEAEKRMLKQNGRNIDLTNTSQRARNFDIMSDS